MSTDLDRFASILRALTPLPMPRILDLGCGDGRCAGALKAYFPDAAIYGVDHDLAALRNMRIGIQAVLADVRALPFASRFGLIVIRHPNVDRAFVAWQQALSKVETRLAEGGILLITCYSAPEAERLRGWLPPLTALPIATAVLAPIDLVGHDRYVFLLKKA